MISMLLALVALSQERPTAAEPRPAALMPATPDYTTAELKPGDVLIASGRKRPERTAELIAKEPQFIGALAQLDRFKELEVWVAPRGRSFKWRDVDNLKLPSGEKVYAIPEETILVLAEIRKADGIKHDVDALRVTPLDGRYYGQPLWTFTRYVWVPLPKPAAQDRVAPDMDFLENRLLMLGMRLESLHRNDVALRVYQTIIDEYPETIWSRLAKARLRRMSAD